MTATEVLRKLFGFSAEVSDYDIVAEVYRMTVDNATKAQLFDLYINNKINEE